MVLGGKAQMPPAYLGLARVPSELIMADGQLLAPSSAATSIVTSTTNHLVPMSPSRLSTQRRAWRDVRGKRRALAII